MTSLTVAPSLRRRTQSILLFGALVAPPLIAYGSILLARVLSSSVFGIVGAGVGIGILVGSCCVARLIRTRLLSFVAVLVYLALTVPAGVYLWGWSRCAALGDCL